MFNAENLKNGDKCLHRPLCEVAFVVRDTIEDGQRFVWGEPIPCDEIERFNFPIGVHAVESQ